MKKNSPTLLAILIIITTVVLLLMYRSPNNIYRPDEKYRAILRAVKAPVLPEKTCRYLTSELWAILLPTAGPLSKKPCKLVGNWAERIVCKGKYFWMDIHLVSNVCLDLREGAELFGSNPAVTCRWYAAVGKVLFCTITALLFMAIN